MPKDIHPFVHELADEARRGSIRRRDFFRYAACYGVSALAASQLVGCSGAAAAAALGPSWTDLDRESPFEIKNLLIRKAQDACAKAGCTMLNAGRGNPDFLNTTVRKSFALLLLFAAERAEQGSSTPDIGFRMNRDGLAADLQTFLKQHATNPGAAFLTQAMDTAETKLGLKPDEVVFELVDGIQGDFYPSPPRIFPVTEAIVNRYLARVVFSGKPPAGAFHLFATEGATAAMIYLFDSLQENMVLNAGDKVAIVAPIFSPYLELPGQRDYQLKPVLLNGSEDQGWQIPDAEVAKLKDPAVKALYMVNPTNPTSVSLNADTVKRMADTIRAHNPNMVIISDTVYASFVDEFNTFGQELPENIIGVYSFSKYFGVTGWRLGVIMTHENCVVDRIIQALPKKQQAQLDLRYRLVSTTPGQIPFHERVEMDSRQVALAHTGGLSGPQQAAMALFALFELLDENYAYKKSIMGILKKRWSALFGGLGIPEPEGNNLTRYYALIDLQRLAETVYDAGFARKLVQGEPLKFLFQLAEKEHVVCLPGAGFAGPHWSLRVALANISEADCAQVGTAIRAVLKDYHSRL